MAFEHAHQFALGRLEPGEQRLDRLVGALVLAQRGERAAQIVGDRQDVARELGRGIGMRVGDFLVLAARDILGLGAGIEQVLLNRGELFGELGRFVLRRRFGGRGLSVRFGSFGFGGCAVVDGGVVFDVSHGPYRISLESDCAVKSTMGTMRA